MNEDAAYVEIIHLSDIHFGRGHVFSLEPTANGRPAPALGMPTLADKLIDDINDPSQNPTGPGAIGTSSAEPGEFPPMPKILCITGDFTQKAALEEFHEAERLIHRLQSDGIGVSEKGNG